MDYIKFKNQEEFNEQTVYFSGGFESKIYRYDNDKLIKKYYDSSEINIDKIKEINKLKSNRLILPENLVEVEDKTIGFSMDLKRGFYPISVLKKDMSDEDKYEVINKIKEELINLKNQNCIYGDLNIKNIITNGNEVYLCDSINVKIDNYNFDEISSTMNEYRKNTDTLDNIEVYMLNLLTLYLFNDIEYEDILNTIRDSLLSDFNKENCNYIGITETLETMNICVDMLSGKINSNYLIDYMNIENKKVR